MLEEVLLELWVRTNYEKWLSMESWKNTKNATRGCGVLKKKHEEDKQNATRKSDSKYVFCDLLHQYWVTAVILILFCDQVLRLDLGSLDLVT
jgi:hypothetical protein